MRIDPKGAIAGYPALMVRGALRVLDLSPDWDQVSLEKASGLPTAKNRAFLHALISAGLVESVRKGAWSITKAGKTPASATAAPRVKRATAERALESFLGRVDFVNRRPAFLGKVVTVILFGSMLNPEIDRVSDVDLAVEIVPKEADSEKARALNERRVCELASLGYRFRGTFERQFFWHREVVGYLKAGSRVISLSDLKAESDVVLTAPHRILHADGAWMPDAPPRTRVVQMHSHSESDGLF